MMDSSLRALTLHGDDLQKPEPAHEEFKILVWVAGQMHSTALSPWSETNYFANQHVRKVEGNNIFVLRGFFKTKCTLKILNWKAVSSSEGQEGGGHTKDIPAMSPKPLLETPGCQQASLWQRLPLNYLCLIDSQGCNWADVSIWHELPLHHEALPVGMCLPAFCSTRMPTEQAKHVHCGHWLWKTHHKICFQKLDGSLMWSW